MNADILLAPSEDERHLFVLLRSCAGSIIGETPCSMAKVREIIAQRGNENVELKTLTVTLRALAFHFPRNFVIENEGMAGYFLIFFDHNFLDELIDVPVGINNESSGNCLQGTIAPFPRANSRDNLWDLVDAEFHADLPYMSNMLETIRDLCLQPTAMEIERANLVRQNTVELPVIEFCQSHSLRTCQEQGGNSCSHKIHFERIIDNRNDRSVDDCSYLDTCFKGKQCRFAHYRIRQPSLRVARPRIRNKSKRLCQQVNADIKTMDLSLLGDNYDALIIDPPWDIHTNPKSKSSGCTDQDVMRLRIDKLQKNGVIFLWVTGRLLEFGRQCLLKWGYGDIEELIWVKTNQLNRTICTGRTGHWINHTKEHVLFARKGDTSNIPSFIDCDVIVSITQGKSKKPRELYGIVDRMVGVDSKKLELFGRASNVRQGWVTVGNELGFTRLHDTLLKLNVGKCY